MGAIRYSVHTTFAQEIDLSENPEMSSSDMLHMFRDYMDSYDQLRLEM